MYEALLRKRLTELRLQKGVSARDMSLSLGQSESYINKIENGKSLPSMEVFFEICDYFGLHPSHFFSDDYGSESELDGLMRQLCSLDSDSVAHIRAIVEKLSE